MSPRHMSEVVNAPVVHGPPSPVLSIIRDARELQRMENSYFQQPKLDTCKLRTSYLQ